MNDPMRENTAQLKKYVNVNQDGESEKANTQKDKEKDQEIDE